jgi:hypothetical protein
VKCIFFNDSTYDNRKNSIDPSLIKDASAIIVLNRYGSNKIYNSYNHINTVSTDFYGLIHPVILGNNYYSENSTEKDYAYSMFERHGISTIAVSNGAFEEGGFEYMFGDDMLRVIKLIYGIDTVIKDKNITYYVNHQNRVSNAKINDVV